MVPENATHCPLCGVAIISPFPSARPDLDNDSDSPTIVVSHRSEQLSARLEPGTVFAGRFRIISRLGAGGMGEVYRADDLRLGQPVALKFLSPELAANERALKLFESEVRLSREVTHPNVCRVHDIGEAEGRHFLSMEFIDGEDLASLLKRIGRLPGEKALDVARQLCAGLGAAHERGVLHRDLKPANIMLDGRGRVRITDFGLALLAEEASQSGEVSGTPHYLAPELFASRTATTRSELYALGLVLYEIFTGKRAFEGTTFAELRTKHERTLPPSPSTLVPDLDPKIEQTTESCIKKDPSQRPASVADVLACLPAGEPVSADRAESNSARTGRVKPAGFPRLSLVAISAGVVALIVVGFLAGRAWLKPTSRDYVQAIAVKSFTHDQVEAVPGLLEFALTRSLSTSADFPIVTDAELALIARGLHQNKAAAVEIGGATRGSPTGIEIDVQVRQHDQTETGHFFARGYQDLLTVQVDRIAAFIRNQTDRTIWRQGTGAPFTQLCTENPDALKHFLDGERAWRKLDLSNSYLLFRDAIEDDPEFTLAHLRLADVLLFRGDPRQAAREMNIAVTGRTRLTRPDLARMEALLARMRSDPREERKHLRELVELFPFRKEYHYELGEAYFHSADAEQAAAEYTKALELDPDYALAHNHLGFCYAWIGEPRKAEEHFQRYVRLDGTANAQDSLAAGYFFAGEYDKAQATALEGLNLDPKLDYLYGTVAKTQMVRSNLEAALKNLDQQEALTASEDTQVETESFRAYLDLLRGDPRGAQARLEPLCQRLSGPEYATRMDESVILPFWLSGVAAARRKDAPLLASTIARLNKKIDAYQVNGSNYFPILKFSLHLQLLQAALRKDRNTAWNLMEEGVRIRNKMGYWSSMFDRAFFLDQYAAVAVELGDKSQARRLLEMVLAYNPNYPPAKSRLASLGR